MKNLRSRMRGNIEGAVAVELALVLGAVLIPLLAAALFFGRFVWHYNVATKAAHDAARFVAAASPTEMKVQCTLLIYKDPCVVMAAMSLATAEMAELNPGGADTPSVVIYCDEQKCATNRGTSVPKMVSADIKMTFEDPFFTGFANFFSLSDGPVMIPIHTTARSHYVGN
jgi:hypothetical protein